MAQILRGEAKEDLSQILRCRAEARWFYSIHSDTTITEASAGLADAISPENGQKWLTCLAVTSQAEDTAYIHKNLTYDMNCGGVY